ncbi:MAG: 50S ribosomal protein L30 [Proteobacteria bacterium SW_6_67_9]|nr:MAG: 50S ribosomal protein L30 [Proteobacteria bacterium SW_6_67_9]
MAKQSSKSAATLRMTQVRSSIGRIRSHKCCLMGLGIRRMNQTVEVADTPENRGMVNKISYMLSVEEV